MAGPSMVGTFLGTPPPWEGVFKRIHIKLFYFVLGVQYFKMIKQGGRLKAISLFIYSALPIFDFCVFRASLISHLIK